MLRSQKSQLWQFHNVQVSEVSIVQVADMRSGAKSSKMSRNGSRMVARSSESTPELPPAIFSPLGPVLRPQTAKILPKLPINRPRRPLCYGCLGAPKCLDPNQACTHLQTWAAQFYTEISGSLTEATPLDLVTLQVCASVRPTRRHGPDWHGTVRHGADTPRHDSAWRGLAWQIEVRGLAYGSEGSGQ